MKTNDALRQSRRRFLHTAGAAAASIVLGRVPLAARAAGGTAEKMKIGVIGSGRVGGTVGELWLKAGYEVMFSSLDLEHDKALAARLGGSARAGTSKQAAVFGDVLFIAVPYAALPQVGRDLGDALKGKIVLDACNPIPARDGEMAVEARAKGTGIAGCRRLGGTTGRRAPGSGRRLRAGRGRWPCPRERFRCRHAHLRQAHDRSRGAPDARYQFVTAMSHRAASSPENRTLRKARW